MTKDFWEGYVPEPVKCKYPKCSYPCSDLPDCQDAQQEPWGACVYGRVFVGRLPEHARKFSEDEGVPIQWLYTSPQPAQRKPLTDEQTMAAYKLACSYGVYESQAFALTEKMFSIFKERK